MKRLLFLLCFISFILNTIAENPDTVYLTNGHIIYGQIIEQSNNEYLKINTNDKGIFVFSFLDIVRINSEQIKNAVVYTQTIGLKQLEEEKNDTTTAEMAYLYDAHPAKKRRDELKLNMLSILLSGVQLEYEHFRGNGISFGTYLSYNNEDSSFGVAPYFRAYAEKRDNGGFIGGYGVVTLSEPVNSIGLGILSGVKGVISNCLVLEIAVSLGVQRNFFHYYYSGDALTGYLGLSLSLGVRF